MSTFALTIVRIDRMWTHQNADLLDQRNKPPRPRNILKINEFSSLFMSESL